MKKILSAACCFLLALAMTAAQAQRYPDKAVSLIVPFPAGGRTDLIGRIVAQHLHTHLDGTVVVVNKPGASGVLGSQEVAQARPDGYTLGFFSVRHRAVHGLHAHRAEGVRPAGHRER